MALDFDGNTGAALTVAADGRAELVLPDRDERRTTWDVCQRRLGVPAVDLLAE